jgi:hypothetical protein
MEKGETLTVHRRAIMALETFSAVERAKVERALRALQDPSAAARVRARSARLSTPEPIYIMRVSPSIRIIFRRTQGGIQVLDAVRRETLDSFAALGADARNRSSTGSSYLNIDMLRQ